MGRATWFDVDGMRKGEWTAEEDRMLVAYINQHSLGDWNSLPSKAGLQRCGKSCRLRWLNYLRPGIKRGKFTPEEEEDIIKFHSLLGNRWAAIAKQMPDRTDNDIKNHWNSCLKKRLVKSGIDPITHKPVLTVVTTTSSSTGSSPLPSISSPSSASARLLNKLAARKHGLDMIKAVILSEPRQVVEEEKITSKESKDGEEEVFGYFMEIDEKLADTKSVSELHSESTKSGFMGLDDYSAIEFELYKDDFYHDIQQLDTFLL